MSRADPVLSTIFLSGGIAQAAIWIAAPVFKVGRAMATLLVRANRFVALDASEIGILEPALSRRVSDIYRVSNINLALIEQACCRFRHGC